MAEQRPRRQQRTDIRQARLPKSRNAPNRPKRISRAEREARRQKQLYIGLGAVAGLLAVILIGTYIWTDVIRPRQTLASVNGTDITREDYWQARGISLVNQVDQYSYLAGVVSGDQASQYQNAAANAQAELDDLWGSTDVNQQFLQTLVEDQLFVQYASEQGIDITDEEVDTFVLNQFAPEGTPLITPTPEPTLIPERASWATQTAAVSAVTGTTTPDPLAGTPAVDGAGTPIAATPIAGGDAASTPLPGTPAAEGTPAPDAMSARDQAETGFRQYRERAFEAANVEESDYIQWVARPALARERVSASIHDSVGQSGPQVHAQHILLSTQELAQQTYDQLSAGANFAELARTLSADTATAPNGGDLGWFSRYDVETSMWDAVSGLEPGTITQPFQTPYGWEIVQVLESSPDRGFTEDQLTAVREAAVQEWLDARAAEANVSGDLDPTPTPATDAFTPPVNAPTGAAASAPVFDAGTPVTIGGTPDPATADPGTPVATPVA
ncbi:MAG TPA: peptidylprolyl isomerase [Thermomicrobiales bacterium]|nr:peptidylprolyl isomerase [Thermomicrobiales bacterium]